MNLRDFLLIVLGVGLLTLAFLGQSSEPPKNPEPICPGPGPCPPQPEPKPAPPRKPRKPWGLLEASVGGPRHSDGTEIHCDLPEHLHVKNRGGSDGAGLCVYASNRHTGLWADDPVFTGMFEWMFSQPGGSYPQKFAKSVKDYAKSKNLPEPPWMQVESDDLEILKVACQAGLMPGVTYGFSPTGRYNGQKISHMVSLVHADEQHFVILDNNYPKSYEWMSPEEFRKTYTGSGRSGWATILLKPGPPPVPRN